MTSLAVRNLHLPKHNLPGKLIVIEGPDCVGRSTQAEALKSWLETQGHGVLSVGLRRSRLVSETIQQAKQGRMLGKRTMALMYVTDFADQLDKGILPALEAGFIIVADRYIYAQIARASVRGCPREWLQGLFCFAPEPDAVLYMTAPPEELLHRTFHKYGRLDYWESGIDLGLDPDPVESFLLYQTLIAQEYADMARMFGFHIVDALQPADVVQAEMRQLIQQQIMGEQGTLSSLQI